MITLGEGYATYDLTVVAATTGSLLRTDLVVDNVQVFLDGGIYTVTGHITNPGPALDSFEIAVALLNDTV